MKMFPLYRVSYGDFDIYNEEVIAVSYSKASLEAEAISLNSKLSKSDRDEEVHYKVGNKGVRVL